MSAIMEKKVRKCTFLQNGKKKLKIKRKNNKMSTAEGEEKRTEFYA